MFRDKLRLEVVNSVKANRIYDYIQESSEEFDPTSEYVSYADYVYDKIVANNIDIENDANVQQIAISICNEAIKTVLLGLAKQTTELPNDRINDLLESELGIKKPEQK